MSHLWRERICPGSVFLSAWWTCLDPLPKIVGIWSDLFTSVRIWLDLVWDLLLALLGSAGICVDLLLDLLLHVLVFLLIGQLLDLLWDLVGCSFLVLTQKSKEQQNKTRKRNNSTKKWKKWKPSGSKTLTNKLDDWSPVGSVVACGRIRCWIRCWVGRLNGRIKKV